jgi:hypothetical protein
MSGQNAEIAQMLIGQLGQHIGFDLMFPEQGFILTEAETFEPRPDVHECRSPFTGNLSRD